MSSEVVFTPGYATAIGLAGIGLDRVGRGSARRRSSGRAVPGAGAEMPWPEVGSIAVHAAIAAVAVIASLALLAVMMIRHHSAADVATLVLPGLLGIAALRGLLGRVKPCTA